jgi:hypothetical protein
MPLPTPRPELWQPVGAEDQDDDGEDDEDFGQAQAGNHVRSFYGDFWMVSLR